MENQDQEIITFGKHKGKTFLYVYDNYKSYCRWIKKTIPSNKNFEDFKKFITFQETDAIEFAEKVLEEFKLFEMDFLNEEEDAEEDSNTEFWEDTPLENLPENFSSFKKSEDEIVFGHHDNKHTFDEIEIRFGKHSGKTFNQVYEKEKNYCKWFLKNHNCAPIYCEFSGISAMRGYYLNYDQYSEKQLNIKDFCYFLKTKHLQRYDFKVLNLDITSIVKEFLLGEDVIKNPNLNNYLEEICLADAENNGVLEEQSDVLNYLYGFDWLDRTTK